MLYRGLKTVPISLYCYHFGPGFILRSLHHNKYDFTPLNAHKKKSQVFTMPLVITPVYLNSQDSGLFGTVGFFLYKGCSEVKKFSYTKLSILKKEWKERCSQTFILVFESYSAFIGPDGTRQTSYTFRNIYKRSRVWTNYKTGIPKKEKQYEPYHHFHFLHGDNLQISMQKVVSLT